MPGTATRLAAAGVRLRWEDHVVTDRIRVLATASSCLAAATAAVAAAGERHLKGTDEPRWPGRIHRELGKTPRVKDWEFRGRKGARRP